MDWFYKLIQDWKDYYYTEPFEIICLTVALFTGLIFSKKEFVDIIFLIYTLSGLLSIFYIIYISHILGLDSTRRNSHIFISNLIVSYIEMAAFMFFFYATLLIKTLKIFIKGSFILFTLINIAIFFQVLFLEISIEQLRKSSYLIIAFQLFPLLFLCFSYYYQILKFKSGEDLFKRPSFWITTSLFFYILLLTPFILIYEELKANHKPLLQIFFAIHYFTFGVIFIVLTHAFLCKKTITT
jgi:hypothetical protein